MHGINYTMLNHWYKARICYQIKILVEFDSPFLIYMDHVCESWMHPKLVLICPVNTMPWDILVSKNNEDKKVSKKERIERDVGIIYV